MSCVSTGKKINLGDEERPRGAGAAAEEAEGRGDRRSDERNLPDQVTEGDTEGYSHFAIASTLVEESFWTPKLFYCSHQHLLTLLHVQLITGYVSEMTSPCNTSRVQELLEFCLFCPIGIKQLYFFCASDASNPVEMQKKRSLANI